jgi:hypothetical protein
MFFVVTSHWLQGKCARINFSQGTSGSILQYHRRLPASIFSVKIGASGFFEAGYWKDFQNY